ncbi:hypothetical protein TCON_0537 [Astathelohania contejeani]|uniref:Uncharacterized protein n=1 Tax=Astathelohania contejeani TaxID=164912 RepID=A0ABQ7I1E6_9MICR|nr:hypothetical protein TCON_0537 [Thelohania contejeani]
MEKLFNSNKSEEEKIILCSLIHERDKELALKLIYEIPYNNRTYQWAIKYLQTDALSSLNLYTPELKSRLARINTRLNYIQHRNLAMNKDIGGYSRMYALIKHFLCKNYSFYNSMFCCIDPIKTIYCILHLIPLDDRLLLDLIKHFGSDAIVQVIEASVVSNRIDGKYVNGYIPRPSKRLIKNIAMLGIFNEILLDRCGVRALKYIKDFELVKKELRKGNIPQLDQKWLDDFFSVLNDQEFQEFKHLLSGKVLVKYLDRFDINETFEKLLQSPNDFVCIGIKKRFNFYTKLTFDEDIQTKCNKLFKRLSKSTLAYIKTELSTLIRISPLTVCIEALNTVYSFGSMVPLIAEAILNQCVIFIDIFYFSVVREFISKIGNLKDTNPLNTKALNPLKNGGFDQWYLSLCKLTKYFISKDEYSNLLLDIIYRLLKSKRYLILPLIEIFADNLITFPDNIKNLLISASVDVFLYGNYDLKLRIDMADRFRDLSDNSSVNINILNYGVLKYLTPNEVKLCYKKGDANKILEEIKKDPPTEFFIIRNVILFISYTLDSIKDFEWIIDFLNRYTNSERDDLKLLCNSCLSRIGIHGEKLSNMNKVKIINVSIKIDDTNNDEKEEGEISDPNKIINEKKIINLRRHKRKYGGCKSRKYRKRRRNVNKIPKV